MSALLYPHGWLWECYITFLNHNVLIFNRDNIMAYTVYWASLVAQMHSVYYSIYYPELIQYPG